MKRPARLTTLLLLAMAIGAVAWPTAAQDDRKTHPAPNTGGAHAPNQGPRDLARPLPPNDPAKRRDDRTEHAYNLTRARDIERLHDHDFHVADVRRFDEREFAAWRAGQWHHDWFNGRRGWWYEAGGVWYPYAAPIFPYPATVAALVVAEGGGVSEPVAAAVVAPLPAAPKAAYHCKDPAGFFPTVVACPNGWTTIGSK